MNIFPGRVSRRDLQLHRALERRNFDLGSRDRLLRRWKLHKRDRFPCRVKTGCLPKGNNDIKIPRGSAAVALFPGPFEAQARSLIHARGNADFDRLRDLDPPLSRAMAAGIQDEFPLSLAAGAGRIGDEKTALRSQRAPCRRSSGQETGAASPGRNGFPGTRDKRFFGGF